MSSQGDQLKSVLGISALASIYGIASVSVWFVLSSYGISAAGRVAIIALILLTWPASILLNHFRKKRAASTVPGQEAQQLPKKAMGKVAVLPTRVYEELTRGAEEVVQWLRSTRLGGTKSGDAVYALPWFLVAGPPASGKTSLLLSSGFDFQALPSQRRAEQFVVRPTRHCEWRVTNSAVLLDTAGRYQNESPDRDEWAALGEIIKKYRDSRPLDGLLVVVSADRVMRSSETEIEQQAKVLRARLDDVIGRMRVRFPVYLVFTGADAIEGFQEFFAAFNREERGQVWGATIPLEKSLNAHALFDVEFDYLSDALLRRRLVRLETPAPPDQQLRIFNLPLRFGDARGKLGLFTSALFRPNPFSESPLLRGFYFTANIGNGDGPMPRGIVAADESEEAAVAKGPGNDFFTKKLFKEVLLSDKDLTASFQAREKRPPVWRNVLLGVTGVMLLALVVGMFVSFAKNKRLVEEARRLGAQALAVPVSDGDKEPRQKDPAGARVEIEAIDNLRKLLVTLDESPPLSLRWGLYSGDDIKPRLRQQYFELITQRFFKPTIAALENDLRTFASNAAPAGSSTPTADAPTAEDVLGQHYDLLKAYLMLTEHTEKAEPTFLVSQLAAYWKKSSPSEMERDALEQLKFYAGQVKYYDTGNIEGNPPARESNASLVADVRHKLRAYPATDRFYKQLTTDINAKVDPVGLDSILHEGGSGVFSGSDSVPGSFTLKGRAQMLSKISSAAEEISKSDWVMEGQTAEEKGQKADTAKLREKYSREYAEQWRKFVEGVSVNSFETKNDAVEALKALADNTDSPLERVLSAVAENTNFSAGQETDSWWARIKGRFTRAAKEESGGLSEAEKWFGPLFRFVAPAGKDKLSAMSQYLTELRNLHQALERANDDKLARTSRTLLTGAEGGDDIGFQTAEKNIDNLIGQFKTPGAKEVAGLLKQPLRNLRALLYETAHGDIEKDWRDRIYPQAQRLETRYPFDVNTNEASVSDIAKYLNPVNGQLTEFFKMRLAASFDKAPGQLKLKENGAIKFSDEFVKYLNNSERLREALFPNGGAQPEVTYEITLQPVRDMNILIKIDDTSVETDGSGTNTTKFNWPARAGGSSGATIKVTSNASGAQEIAPRTFPGEWGLFRMFADGSHKKVGDNQYDLYWNVGGIPVRATLKPASADDPFQPGLFNAVRAPQDLK